MKPLHIILAVVGGAIAGAAVGLLFAPEKGADTRARIKALLKSKGIDFTDDEVEQLVEKITEDAEV